MKLFKFKKTLATFTAFALCLVSFIGSDITAQADETVTTYYVKYDAEDADWRFETDNGVANGFDRELYYLYQNIKDGDKLVIEGSGEKTLYMDINASLSEVTFFDAHSPVVTAKSIDTVYGLFGSTFAVNGDVKNAYLYEDCICNFNNNVGYIEVINSSEDNIKATVTIKGTVDHAKALGKTKTLFELYSFQAGSFKIEKGALWATQEQCSYSPAEATPAPATPAPAAPSTTTPSTSTGEYDDVPKTADIRFNPLWLVGIAAICFAGSYALKKEK